MGSLRAAALLAVAGCALLPGLDLGPLVEDLGTSHAAGVNPDRTEVRTLVAYRGLLHLFGESGTNSRPNRVVRWDPVRRAFDNERDAGGAVVVLNAEAVRNGWDRHGDLVLTAEDGASGRNDSMLFVRGEQGWRLYASPEAEGNAHQQGQYLFAGRIFATSGRSPRQPGIYTSADDGRTWDSRDLRGSGPSFPPAWTWLTSAFIEYQGGLFAFSLPSSGLVGQPAPARGWGLHWTGNSAIPWEPVWDDHGRLLGAGTGDGTFGSRLPERWVDWDGRLVALFADSLVRCEGEAAEGLAGPYVRPGPATTIAAPVYDLVARRGRLLALWGAADGKRLRLMRSADGIAWSELGTLALAAHPDLAPGIGVRPRIEVLGEDLYLAGRLRLYRLPGAAVGGFTAANRPPVAVDDVVEAAPGGPVAVPVSWRGLLANDRDPDGDGLRIIDHDPPASGTIAVAANGTFAFHPAPGSAGEVVVAYRIGDGLATATAALRIRIGPAPARPVLRVAGAVIPVGGLGWAPGATAGTPAVIPVEIANTGGSGLVLADIRITARHGLAASFAGLEGVLAPGATVPAALHVAPGAPGVWTLAVAGAGASWLLRGTVAGTGAAQAPSAIPFALQEREDTAGGTFALTGSDPDGRVVAAVIEHPPVRGTLSRSGDLWRYTPARDANGGDAFAYRVRDEGGLLGAAATVAIAISAVNDPPVAATPPSVAGPAVVGAPLAGDPGSWNDVRDRGPPPVLALRWQRAADAAGGGAATIPGATAATYVPVAADAGRWLRLVVSATDQGDPPPGATTTAASPWTGPCLSAGAGPQLPVPPGADPADLALP